MDNPSRRLHVVTECYPRPQALHHCAFAHRQLLGLRDSGWETEVLIPNGWYPPGAWRLARPWRSAKLASVPRGWAIDGIGVRDLSYRNPVPGRLLRQALGDRIAEALVRHLRDRAVAGQDVILVQFALPYGPAVREAAKVLGLPYVVQLRGDDVWVWPHRNDVSRRAFVETLSDARLVLGVSAALINEARHLAGRPLAAIAVVPNGIDLERFRPAQSPEERHAARAAFGIAEDEIAVLCVADFIVRKGWLDLLDALGDVPTDGNRVKLIAAAAAPVDELDLVAEARARTPSTSVEMRRGIAHDRLADLYRAADVFCLPSHWEGIANALLEAMATGLACVTTAVSGHPEVITTDVDGILVPPKDVAALRSALERVFSSVALRNELGRNARLRAEAVGDSRRAGRRLSALLEGVRSDAFASDVAQIDPYAVPEHIATGT
jgi:glycosyltransferase involved in cell wall biosynthesis